MADTSKKNKSKLLDTLMIMIGLLLIAAAGVIMISQADFSKKQSAQTVVSALEAIIPSCSRALPEPRYGGGMPSAEIGGENFVGLLKIERYNCVLPIGTVWDQEQIDRFPMVFSGNIYDRNLMIGGGNSEGQFDFVDEIEIGTSVKYLDLFGRVFWYEVSMVNHAESIDKIESGEDDLTLFARSKNTSKYVIIRCRLSNM